MSDNHIASSAGDDGPACNQQGEGGHLSHPTHLTH